ncbi:MAG TPA: helix-turn-helix domain-containing protein [Myxococcota bacterium]|nr:helix-turn-helix domain-containing protein [Myxococcota bacterium]
MSRNASDEAQAQVFAALGDATRLLVLRRLARQCEASIAQLAGDHAISRQALTKHLEVLASAGLVTDERRGRERVFALDGAKLANARRLLDEVGAAWEARLGRLQALFRDDM